MVGCKLAPVILHITHHPAWHTLLTTPSNLDNSYWTGLHHLYCTTPTVPRTRRVISHLLHTGLIMYNKLRRSSPRLPRDFRGRSAPIWHKALEALAAPYTALCLIHRQLLRSSPGKTHFPLYLKFSGNFSFSSLHDAVFIFRKFAFTKCDIHQCTQIFYPK